MEHSQRSLTVRCPSCAHENRFDQPHPYHAGFSNVGFLYNEAGNLTLVWSALDPAYVAIAGERLPWGLTPELRREIEAALLPSPAGDRWLFQNVPRCAKCREAIGGSIVNGIDYFLHPGSIDVSTDLEVRSLGQVLRRK